MTDFEKLADDLISLAGMFHLLKKYADGKPFFLDPHYWVLAILCKKNQTMSDLGNHLQRTKPNMTAIINRLIEEGKVRRLPDEKDRRIIRIEITEKGRQAVTHKKEEIKATLIKNLAHLEPEDLSSLSNALSEMKRIITLLRQVEL
jgi:DNA-binding MarR family transcriptional regulator